MNTVQSEWESFYKSVYDGVDVPEVQHQVLKIGFHMGLHASLTELTNARSDKKLIDMMDTFERDIITFSEQKSINGTFSDRLFRQSFSFDDEMVEADAQRMYFAGIMSTLSLISAVSDQGLSVQASTAIRDGWFDECKVVIESNGMVVPKYKKKKKRSGRP